MLFTILKKTLGPFGLILVIIIALMMGRSRFPFVRNIPGWVLIVAVIALIVGWLGFLFFKWFTEKRRAAAIEEGILNQAQAGLDQAAPARRAKIEELNKNLAEALTMLKQGPQGKKALYSLPWYMIIGQPSAGKTVAIKNSNLNFPGMTTAKRMKGAGGTRSCDWWFSTDAILLDTAGRYVDGADRSETEDEWFGFLDLLKSHRKNGPIDGLVLAYSVEDLFLKDEVGVVDLARDLRQRMDEILDRLGWTFPVYVLFTKCDLISGFTDYFSSLSPLERHQAWGAVYSPEPEGDQRAAERFTEEFDLLLANLRNTRPHRMSSVSRSEDWGRVFMFPEELASLKAKMVLLIETLFEANPYRKDVPIFRGTYFSSGKQEGKPFDLVVQKIQSMLGVRSEFDEAEVQEEKEDAYFVRDLFAKVLKTDRDLVRVTGKAARSRARLALIASTGFLVLGVLACVWIGVSYGRLRNRMDQTRNVAEKFVNQEEIGTGIEELEKLERLRAKITGSWRSFPLVVTDSVHVYAQGVYHQALSERFLIPVEERIARELRNANSLNAAEVRQALRAELMLLMPDKRDDIGWNAQELTESLYKFGLNDVKDDAEARQQMKSLVTEFLLLERPLPEVSRPNELLRGARRLAETHAPREFFRGIIHEASQTGDDLTLEALVPDQSILRSRGTIRRAYTRAGWEQTVQSQVRDVKKTWEADNQLIVLAGGDPSPSHPEKEELLKLYENSYPEEWVAFFESVRYKSYTNCDDLEPDLRRLLLTGTSPLFTLLREAEDASGLGTGPLGEAASGSGSTAKIDAALKPLRNLVVKEDDVPAPLDEFREELKAVYEQVDECANEPDFKVSGSAVRGAKRWLNDFVDRSGNAPMASALRTLMMGPVDLADDALEQKVVEEVDRERQAARQQLQAEWANAADVFSSRLARTYPFDDRDKYADPGDVVELFGPGGTLAGFAEFSAQSPIRAGRATTNALQGAEKIRNSLNMTNDGFEAQFRLQALSVNSTGSARGDENRRKIDTVILTINGEQLKDRLSQTHRDFTWHSKDENLECSLELKSSRSRADIASIGFTGTTWSICKLFDRAQVTETNEGRKVVWPFPEHDIEIEFLLTTREDAEPFFISNSAFRRFSLRPGVHE